jgi:lipoate-protein ligase A
LTFSHPASNLACDEALLELCEKNEEDGFLRIWEPDHYFVVVGYSNRVVSEVNVTACEARGIPIFRRFSGGGTVLQGPGCLNYSLAVKHNPLGIPAELKDSYRFVLERHRKFCARQARPFRSRASAISLDGRKFSGNAQHRKRLCSLFHGTFLLSFDKALIETHVCYAVKEQPDYRHGALEDFLCNLSMKPEDIRRALRRAWGANEQLQKTPSERIEALVDDRYSRKEWNFKY